MLIDALERPHPEAALGTRWKLVTDGVMGGVSEGSLARKIVGRRPALRLRGRVRLENNGGFVQAALDLALDGTTVDLSDQAGIELDVTGNGENYGLHLRTADVVRPWQSYRATFRAGPEWRRLRLPFTTFEPHRIDTPLDPSRLRRLGLFAIGRAFVADIALARIATYAETDPAP